MAYFNPSSTNGASLEDCHTNVFVLTELNGLKWCRWCSSNTTMIFNDLSDEPVLCAYGRCVSQGYLCVWRRSLPVHASSKVDLRLSTEKELWVFWYGDEPDWGPLCIGLTKIEEGSWEKGVEYETRTMLFKALHNQIDRVLLNYGFLRFGKWYAQPLDFSSSKSKSYRSKYVIAFHFSFFVHGENNVCVTVEVQRHAPIYRLSKRLLVADSKRSVILAPWSISAQINVDLATWQRETNDAQEQRCLQDWCKFYAFVDGGAAKPSADGYDQDAVVNLPRMVDVVLNGVKLKYPSKMVVAVDEESGLVVAQPDDDPTPKNKKNKRFLFGDDSSLSQCQFHQWLLEKTCEGLVCNQKSALEPSTSQPSSSCESSDESAVGAWKFVDLSQREPCRCAEKVGLFSALKRAAKKAPARCRTLSGKQADSFHRRRRLALPQLSGLDDYGADGAYANCPATTSNEEVVGQDWYASKNDSQQHRTLGAALCNSPAADEHRSKLTTAYSSGSAAPGRNANSTTSKLDFVEAASVVTPKYSGVEFAKVNNNLLSGRIACRRKVQADQATVDVVDSEPKPSAAQPTDIVSDHFYRHLSSCHLNNVSMELAKASKKIKLAVHLSEAAEGWHDPVPRAAEDAVDGQPLKVEGGEHALISDNEEDLLHAFLSPPPSHGQEEEAAASVKKPAAGKLKSKEEVNCQSGVVAFASASANHVKPVPSSMDHLGIIYPTPPSQEAVLQMSPEAVCQNVAFSSGEDQVAVGTVQCKALSSSSSCDKGAVDWEALLQRDSMTAKMLVTPSFESLDCVSVRRRPAAYRPSKLFLPPYQQQQLIMPMYAPMAAGYGSMQFRGVHPPHHQGGFEPSSRSIISAPASVRSFNEHSPAMLNPPSVSSHFVRTPLNELQSPMSNASSAYARNLSSIEPVSCDQAVQCEGNGLLMTLLLSDTVIDLHRDIVFDSCPLCVCNMNVRGLEMGFYIDPVKRSNSSGVASASHWTTRCTCGFSAVRHRYLSFKSGVFFEDEDDATGSVWERLAPDRPRSSDFSREIVELVRHQSLLPDLTCSLMTFRPSFYVENGADAWLNGPSDKFLYNWVELRDVANLCKQCLDQACASNDAGAGPSMRQESSSSSSAGGRKSLISSYGYSMSSEMSGSLETVALLRSLLPLLQESLQKPRGLWQAKHSVEGPLTWRQLHRKCSHRPGSNGREDLSGPEPIPELLVGCEHDWISASPFSVGLWNRVGLEPFTQPKDVVFIAVVPDSHYVVRKARNFFRELSRTYEAMHLGRHVPITRVLKDGIMRVGKTHAKQLNQKPVDQWFDQFDTTGELRRLIGSKLKLYAQVCRHYLAPHIFSPIWNAFDRSVFTESGKESAPLMDNAAASSSTPSPPMIAGVDNGSSSLTSSSSSDAAAAEARQGDGCASTDAAVIPHVVVIYLVNPFNFGPEERYSDLNRLVTTGLFRCYLEILQDIPVNLRGSMQLQIIPLQTLLDTSLLDEWEVVGGQSERGRLSSTSHLRSLAFSVFMQVRSVGYNCLQPCLPGVLTGFGAQSGRAELLRRKQDYPNFRLYSTPAVLMPRVERTSTVLCSSELRDDYGQVLFLTYCLSSDQQWLLSTVTDQVGSMLDSCVINMILNNRKNVVQREVIWTALRRLWDFVVGILATSSRPWRIVVGRFGRLGHEELKAWAHLLSKSQLRSTSRLLREQCSVCQPMPSIFETPAILSACLISTELDANLRIFPDSFVHDDRFGQSAKQCPLSTPEDVTCSHVMVFPTSALIQISQCCIMTGGLSGTEDAEGDFDSLWKDLMIGGDGDGLESGLSDLFGSIGDTTLINDNTVPFDSNNAHSRGLAISESSDESIQLQPLALGFLISTAPTGPVPDWFWTTRPSARNALPVHLRSALHIHTSAVQQSDDHLLPGGTSRSVGSGNNHPLDSNLTTDVLRYVLETYNALSWLSHDLKSGDRLSCFPLHAQALFRLYRAVDNLL